jgi:uncharacterized membrane protein
MSAWVSALTLMSTVAMTGFLVEWIARSRHPRRLLFVALGRERTAADEARVRRLRLANAVFTAFGLLAATGLLGAAVQLGAVTLAPILSIGWLMAELAGVVRSAEPEAVPGRYAVSLSETPTVWDIVSLPLQLANVLTLVVPMAVFLWIGSRLPSELPMHWDASGTVDRYGHPAELWTLGAFIAFDLLILWAVAWGIAAERWAMPEEGAETYLGLQLRRRRLMVRMLEWILLAVNAGLALCWIAIALQGMSGVVVLLMMALLAVGTLAPLVAYVGPLLRVQERIREIAGTDVLGTHPSGWKLGGTVYYAPADPALFVPKKVGLGQTLNMARPGAWAFLGLILGLPLLVSIIAAIALG